MLKANRHNGHRFNDLDAMLLDRLNDVTCSSKCLTYAQVQIMFSLAGGIRKWAADNDVIMSKSDAVYAELTYLFDEFAGDCFKYTASMDSTRLKVSLDLLDAGVFDGLFLRYGSYAVAKENLEHTEDTHVASVWHVGCTDCSLDMAKWKPVRAKIYRRLREVYIGHNIKCLTMYNYSNLTKHRRTRTP